MNQLSINCSIGFQNITTVPTGLSDLDKFILVVLKTMSAQSKPNQLIFRDYKKYDTNYVDEDLIKDFLHKQP